MRVLPLTLLLTLGAPATAGAAPRARRSEVQVERVSAPRLQDEQLLDQDGRPVRLASELLKDRVVVVNFVSSACATGCPPTSEVFSRLRAELGDVVGRDVHLVSITLDPAHDTPERLRAFSSRFGRGEGWTFVTGEPRRVRRALKALGGWVPDKAAPPPVTLVGNTTTGRWVRVFGLPTPQRLKEALAEVGATVSAQRQPLRPPDAR